MKLRNKKTGKIVEVKLIQINDKYLKDREIETIYSESITLETLNKYYEDYDPKLPLIKDEKIRKAVRTWAEACGLRYVTYKQASNEFYDPDTRGAFAIKFKLMPVEVYLEDGECYTIAELCGEGEE